MDALKIAGTGERKSKDTTVRYEVHRMREHRGETAAEEFNGLDRARLAALGYALDGPTTMGQCYSGLVQIRQVFYLSGVMCRTELIDEVDERVALRLLNEVTLPRADQLAVPLSRIQAEVNALRPYE